MKRLTLVFLAVSICLIFLSTGVRDSYSFSNSLNTNTVQRISKDELKAILDDPDTVIIDVRLQRDWEMSDKKIQGAVHEDPLSEEESWAGNYSKDKNLVLY